MRTLGGQMAKGIQDLTDPISAVIFSPHDESHILAPQGSNQPGLCAVVSVHCRPTPGSRCQFFSFFNLPRFLLPQSLPSFLSYVCMEGSDTCPQPSCL